MSSDHFYRSSPQWFRVVILVCAPLFLCLPASILVKGTFREVLMALGLIGLGLVGMLFAAHGALFGHLPPDPLGRVPSSPSRNPALYWFVVLLIGCSAAGATFIGFAGLMSSYSKLVAH